VIARQGPNIQETLAAKDTEPMNPKKTSPTFVLVLVAACAAALGGCASPSATAEEARTPATARELNRADAIASAREDALRSYGGGWDAQADARYQGGYWLVELQARTGYRLRYAISAHDGSIRERNMVQ
jgi:hypothetical protein